MRAAAGTDDASSGGPSKEIDMAKGTTLITGASSGIGLHLSHEFAKHGHPLVLVAPVAAELEQVAADIRGTFGVEVEAIACNLEVDSDRMALIERFSDGRGTVDVLVNNAGKGQRGRFWEIDFERQRGMVELNVVAVLELTHAIVRAMIARGSGRILNVASVAGFEPGPNLAVYHATKAFVLSWSEALATELDDTPITVTALCPGPTDTDFFAKADMEETRAFQQANLMAPQDVAAEGYRATMDGERVVVAGAANKTMVFSRRFMSEALQAKKNEKLYEDAPPAKQTRERGEKEGSPAAGAHRRH
jgi:uncharacterized protein